MYGALQPTHLLLILFIVLIIFGPGKMVGMGKKLGETVREFKNEVTVEDDQEKKNENS
ncbi:sec-independent translocation protein mttA/Hcf106 [Desulforamulus reducens MI-1]|uniref:Sec-independent translocation protein mttA/Hcf106 n=1 Tax=Desulforamulus reducens (strain ATCC BAA-1160 / DSM 100696 / MI-1) TaxID=349161 RepID=A4J4N5_DESRM|nr:twin-arginine translocase TatA/TatE family subunit [Desulforamulus reducens]ABO50038.1 sec-independent translocation protein mttA/Hcf106 [Desulforamulus reducens MI-1]